MVGQLASKAIAIFCMAATHCVKLIYGPYETDGEIGMQDGAYTPVEACKMLRAKSQNS